MRVLIADDEPTGALMLSRSLGRWGLEVVVAHDGEEAWRMIQNGGIAMAILDWMMPGADGPELCRRIRKDERHAHMHLILLTARNSRADVVAGLDAGADDYLISRSTSRNCAPACTSAFVSSPFRTASPTVWRNCRRRWPTSSS